MKKWPLVMMLKWLGSSPYLQSRPVHLIVLAAKSMDYTTATRLT